MTEKNKELRELRLNLSFFVEGKDLDLAEARNKLEERFNRENKTAENEFWDNLELVIEEGEEKRCACGDTFKTEEEEEIGFCGGCR